MQYGSLVSFLVATETIPRVSLHVLVVEDIPREMDMKVRLVLRSLLARGTR